MATVWDPRYFSQYRDSATGWTVLSSSPGSGKIVPFKESRRGRAPPASSNGGEPGFFPGGVKRPRSNVNPSPSSAKLNNVWHHSFTPSIRLHGEEGGSFALPL